MATREEIRKLVVELGEPYSQMLGIDLRNGGDPAYFRWFLAAFLYAKPIREESATKTYQVFEAHGLTTPAAIENAGWDRLVELLGEGGYRRYDESTASRLLAISDHLRKEYDGKLSRLYETSKDGIDLERHIRELGKGIGPVTVSVFLRDMQQVWPKADPQPVPDVERAAAELGIDDVKAYAKKNGIDIIRLETALHRYARETRRHRLVEAR
jgi:endonuclease III